MPKESSPSRCSFDGLPGAGTALMAGAGPGEMPEEGCRRLVEAPDGEAFIAACTLRR